MEKLLTILFITAITALMAMVAGNVEALRPPEPEPPAARLMSGNQKLDPQEIIVTWEMVAEQCYGMQPPDKTPKEVTIYFNAEEAYAIIWRDDNGVEFICVKEEGIWKQTKPGLPGASEGK